MAFYKCDYYYYYYYFIFIFITQSHSLRYVIISLSHKRRHVFTPWAIETYHLVFDYNSGLGFQNLGVKERRAL